MAALHNIPAHQAYNANPFTSTPCLIPFPTQPALATHQARTHSKFSCPSCAAIIPNRRLLHEHIHSQHADQGILCDVVAQGNADNNILAAEATPEPSADKEPFTLASKYFWRLNRRRDASRRRAKALERWGSVSDVFCRGRKASEGEVVERMRGEDAHAEADCRDELWSGGASDGRGGNVKGSGESADELDGVQRTAKLGKYPWLRARRDSFLEV